MKNYSLSHAEFASDDNVKLTTLPNGLRVVTVYRPVQSVIVSVFVNVGSRFETEAENGLSHFLEHMAFKGTPTRSSKDITFEVEHLGASVNAFTSHEMTAYYVAGLSDHIGPALDILSDVLMNSVMDPNEIEREQNVVLDEIDRSQDNIDDVAMDALSATAYPNQAIGRPILGSKDNVLSFKKENLLDYLKRHCHANGLIVLCTGDIDHDLFVDEVTSRFGTIEPGETPAPVPTQYVGGTTLILDGRFSQAHIHMAFPCPGSVDDDFARFDLLSDVLGTGMSSPLFQEVREKAGLGYVVSAGLFPHNDRSLFVVGGACSAGHVSEFMKKSLGELVKIANGTIEDTDWERARNQVTRQIVSRSESSMSLAQMSAAQLFALGHTRSLSDMKKRYLNVTREEVIAAARELISSVPTIIVAGNAPDADYDGLVADVISSK
jgi:predicted Zn-dependent peptidase